MATAQILKATHAVDDRVVSVDDRVKAVDDKVTEVVSGEQHELSQSPKKC